MMCVYYYRYTDYSASGGIKIYMCGATTTTTMTMMMMMAVGPAVIITIGPADRTGRATEATREDAIVRGEGETANVIISCYHIYNSRGSIHTSAAEAVSRSDNFLCGSVVILLYLCYVIIIVVITFYRHPYHHHRNINFMYLPPSARG